MGRVLVAVSFTKLETSNLTMLWPCTFKMTTLETLFTLSVAFSSSNHMMNRSKLTTTQLILHTLGFHSDIFSKLTFAHTFADIEARHSSLAKSRSQFDNCQMPEPSPLFTDALTINQNTPQNYLQKSLLFQLSQWGQQSSFLWCFYYLLHFVWNCPAITWWLMAPFVHSVWNQSCCFQHCFPIYFQISVKYFC